MDNAVVLLCLMGLPGSGKTYLSRLIVQRKLDFEQVLHISFDDLFHWDGDFIVKKKRQHLFNIVKNTIKSFLQNPQYSLLIVLDDNMYYRSMRHEYFKLARKYNIKFSTVYIDTDIIDCLDNNYNRKPSIPTHILLDMNDKLEPPTGKNYWEVNSIRISYKKYDMEECLRKIRVLLENSLVCGLKDNVTEDKEVNLGPKKVESVHLADLALRQLVSRFIRASQLSQEESKKLNSKRVQILESIRNCQLLLPSIDPQSTTQDILSIYTDHLKHLLS